MIKSKLKDSKGISLVSLSIAVILIIIISNVVIYNVKDNLKLENLKNMQNDIENLSDKVEDYYIKNGKLPVKSLYKNIDHIDVISSATDTGDFYIIDLKSLENLTLNYGKDYKKIIDDNITEEEIQTLKDIYIINEDSHNIFYVEGINIDKETYYTNYTREDVDKEKVNLRYVDNIKIPDGFSYVSGTRDTGIHIKSIEDNSKEYIWQIVENIINDVPENIEIKEEEKEDFKKSVNEYKGFYKSTTDNTVIYLKLEEKWSPTYDKEGIYRDKNMNKVKISKGFQVCLTPGKNTVENGLVIRNTQTDDRYVWIDVPKSLLVYKKAGLDITEFTEEECNKIYEDLKEYTIDYKNEADTDEWYSGCGIEKQEDYNKLKNEMLKSVYENGGFWIGQYEAGVEIARNSENDELKTAITKKGAYPYNYVKCEQAQEMATKVESGDYTSSLMFGIQWDLVLKHIETKGGKKKEQLNKDSSEWGNYRNAEFDVKEGKCAVYNLTSKKLEEWSEISQDYTKPGDGEENRVLLTTGEIERNSVLNIYDLAGNVYEWTLENSKNKGPATARAGNYGGSGKEQFACFRSGSSIQKIYNYVGFRITLY